MDTQQNTSAVVVKIIDSQLGKAEIIDHGNSRVVLENIAVKGSQFTSRDLSGYAIGTTLLVSLEITGKGSRKVRSVTNYDVSHKSPDNAPTVATVAAPIVTQTTVNSQPSPSVALPVVDILAWQSPDYYIAPDLRLAFATVYNFLVRDPKRSVKVLLTGDSGYGKTTLAEKIANLLRLDYIRVNCASMRDNTDWFGYSEITIDPVTNQQVTTFEDTQFSRAITRGNCVIVLDEFNRVQPDLHNSLFPLLDDSQCTEIHNRKFVVGENVIFVATINQGFQFNATFDLDLAIVNRFDFTLEVRAMPVDQEINVLVKRTGISDYDASEIVRMANILRESNHSCSTRVTLLLARMVVNGLTIRQALEFAVVKRIPPTVEYANQRKNVLDLINVHFGEYN